MKAGSPEMSLEDALTALVPKPKPRGCKTCAWLADQSVAVQDYVQDWLIKEHSTKQLHDVLKQHGYPLSISGFKFHSEHVREDNR